MAWRNGGKNSGYKIASSFVANLGLRSGESTRTDCPVCGGRNVFSVTKDHSGVKFNCFRLSCGISGTSHIGYSYEDMRHRLAYVPIIPADGPLGLTNQTTLNNYTNIPSLPAHFKPVERFDERWSYLEKYNATDIFDYHPDKFYYDPIQERLVFVEYDNSKAPRFATGRSLAGDTPKWYKYIDEVSLFSAHKYEMGMLIDEDQRRYFICEDALSACSLGRLGIAISLNGTSYDPREIKEFMRDSGFPIYVCLDADATMKALRLKRDLEGYIGVPVFVVTFSDDAKYLTYHQLKKELNKDGATAKTYDYLYRG